MKIRKRIEKAKLTVAPVGRLDHITAAELALDGIDEVVSNVVRCSV